MYISIQVGLFFDLLAREIAFLVASTSDFKCFSYFDITTALHESLRCCEFVI